MQVGERVVLHYSNGETETIKLPFFGSVSITIQNGKIYKVEQSSTEIKKN